MKKLIILTISFWVLTSCSDEFLNLKPEQSVANEEALTNLEDYNSSITGVYNDLQSPDYYGRYFIIIPDVMADDVKQNSQANRAIDFAQYLVTIQNADARNMWTLMYRAINSLNEIINADITVDNSVQADKDHIVGEALALRGLIYFDLVRLYAQHYTFTADASHLGVPISLSFNPTNRPGRNSVKEVYDQVIDDMTTGISLMKNQSRSGTNTTLSKTAVKALLSRVYLYKEDWANAELMASEVIQDNTYALVSNANYMNLWNTNNTSESLFEIAMSAADNVGNNSLAALYLPQIFGDYLPSSDVTSLFEPNDVRLQTFFVDPLLSGNYAPYRMGKYPDVLGLNNVKVMRLAEVYLIRAEARARLGTNTAGAQADYNTVHQRGVSDAPNTTLTGTDLLDAILLERRLELCFEGQRLWDLMRNKQDIVRTQCTSITCFIEYGNHAVIFPIPQAELDANPNIEPNPGFN
jgi:hypothetical protein